MEMFTTPMISKDKQTMAKWFAKGWRVSYFSQVSKDWQDLGFYSYDKAYKLVFN